MHLSTASSMCTLMSVMMSGISRSTLDCNSTTLWLQRSLSGAKQYRYQNGYSFVPEEDHCGWNFCNLQCYMKCSTSLLTITAIAMCLYHIILNGCLLDHIRHMKSMLDTIYYYQSLLLYKFDCYLVPCLLAEGYWQTCLLPRYVCNTCPFLQQWRGQLVYRASC